MAERERPPEWRPDDAGPEFASRVVAGRSDDAPGSPAKTTRPVRKRALTADDHVEGVLASDRTILARTITLIESNRQAHATVAREVLRRVLPRAGRSIRIGITGVPGVGKSTFIEAFGSMLCEAGHRVAVLAVDPSSSVSRGSILGDKTRMEKLSHHPNAFIRPSPTGGTLGGVTRRSRETIVLCEAAGFDVVLVETVGVGQSEVAVRSMVDFFMLLMLSGAGDELQGIKKGLLERADIIAVNKADGDQKAAADIAASELISALKILASGAATPVLTVSARTGAGLDRLWREIVRLREVLERDGALTERRRRQGIRWMRDMVADGLEAYLKARAGEEIAALEKAVGAGEMAPTAAAARVLERLP